MEGDGNLLARLFENLLNNAVKYGKDGKIIRVAAKVVHEHVLVQVINYGYVIPKEDLEKLFQKFYRVEQSRSQNTGGTGLGLAIVHQIAVLHGGDVQVKSDLDGTVFSVWLPLQQTKGETDMRKHIRGIVLVLLILLLPCLVWAEDEPENDIEITLNWGFNGRSGKQ